MVIFWGLGMGKGKFSQNFEGPNLEKYEPQKDVSWINIQVRKISLSNWIEFGNLKNTNFLGLLDNIPWEGKFELSL